MGVLLVGIIMIAAEQRVVRNFLLNASCFQY